MPIGAYDGTHGYITNTWRFPAVPGESLLDWIATDLCTHYWLQRIEIQPASPKLRLDVPGKIQAGRLRLVLHARSGHHL